MSVRVKIFDGAGNELSTRRFIPGDRIDVNGYVTGMFGGPEPFTHIRVDIAEIAFLQETSTNLWGVFDVQVPLPTRPMNLTVKITATFTTSGQDVVVIPIAVGESSSLPPLPAPPPQGAYLSDLSTVLMWGLVIAAVVMFLPPLLSTRSFHQRRSNSNGS